MSASKKSHCITDRNLRPIRNGSFLSARPALSSIGGRYPYSLLNPGSLAAHRGVRLVLLHSCPDTVHRVLLRKTRISTPLIRGKLRRMSPGAGHHPCCSGLQVQGTAISPAVRIAFSIHIRPLFVKDFPRVQTAGRHEKCLLFHPIYANILKSELWADSRVAKGDRL